MKHKIHIQVQVNKIADAQLISFPISKENSTITNILQQNNKQVLMIREKDQIQDLDIPCELGSVMAICQLEQGC